MKKMIQRILGISTAVVMLLFLLSNYMLQIKSLEKEQVHASQDLFWQIEQILERNNEQLTEVKSNFKEDCMIRAKAAAYILKDRPDILNNPSEIKHLTELLQIDELHAFDSEGTLYAGSEPKYFGYTFYSGKQMNFFLPMLKDHSLALCQDISPNTAEGKLMQYAAAWQEDFNNIIQIGMEPKRIIALTERNQISQVFSMLTADQNTVLYAVNPETYEILGSTESDLVGQTLTDITIPIEKIASGNEFFFTQINGVSNFCVFSQRDDILLGRSYPAKLFYSAVNKSTLTLVLFLAAIFAIMLAAISLYLDKNIITAISAINKKLEKISNGNLNEQVDVHTTPEFNELSGYINRMVESLLNSADKVSTILDIIDLPIGTYEYGPGMERVLASRRIPSILGLSETESQKILADSHLFEKELEKILQNPFAEEQSIYQMDGSPNRYIKIESFTRGSNTLGILLDVTEEILERLQIEQERDYDLLTGLYCRRAFYTHLDALFSQPELLKHSAMVMIDANSLKQINDIHGHQNGDRYLRAIADSIRSIRAPHRLYARLGGDEFSVLIYDCDSREELQKYLDELYDKSEKPYLLNPDIPLQVTLSFSMGAAFYDKDGTSYHELLKWADGRMYEDKRQKKKNR